MNVCIGVDVPGYMRICVHGVAVHTHLCSCGCVSCISGIDMYIQVRDHTSCSMLNTSTRIDRVKALATTSRSPSRPEVWQVCADNNALIQIRHAHAYVREYMSYSQARPSLRGPARHP